MLSRKAAILPKETALRKSKKDSEIAGKKARVALKEAMIKESEERLRRGKKGKHMRFGIEKDILDKYNCGFSKYHGGKMEGPSLRNLMKDADVIFDDICSYLKENYEQQETETVPVTGKEIETVCFSYARLAILLDGIISKSLTKRGDVTKELIQDLKKELFLLKNEFERMKMSKTPKYHMALDHLPEILEEIGGFVKLLEDELERGHQKLAKICQRLVRMRNDKLEKKSQARFENVGMMSPVKKVQENVSQNCKRKFKKETSIKEERDAKKKEERTVKREIAAASVNDQNKRIKLLKPKEVVKEALKK